MSIGITVPLPAYHVDVAFIAKKAEELGFESIWCAEHPIIPVHSDSPFPSSPDGVIPESYSHFVDPFVALARASGVTTEIKLGTGITLVPERNPLLLAKEVSTLDHFSGGRFLFGIGTGWLREETEIMGGDFDHRWTQAREAVQVMKKLWTEEEAAHTGRYYNFPPVKSYPKPFQKPHPPVLLGGMAPNVLRRVVAWADGWLPNRITHQALREKARGTQHHGRPGRPRPRIPHHLRPWSALGTGSGQSIPQRRGQPGNHPNRVYKKREGDIGPVGANCRRRSLGHSESANSASRTSAC